MAVGIASEISSSRIGIVMVSVAGSRVRKMPDTCSRVIQLLPKSKLMISRTKIASCAYQGLSSPSSRHGVDLLLARHLARQDLRRVAAEELEQEENEQDDP